jgi:hypothetical protein
LASVLGGQRSIALTVSPFSSMKIVIGSRALTLPKTLSWQLLTDVVSRIADHKIDRIDELLPWRYTQNN